MPVGFNQVELKKWLEDEYNHDFYTPAICIAKVKTIINDIKHGRRKILPRYTDRVEGEEAMITTGTLPKNKMIIIHTSEELRDLLKLLASKIGLKYEERSEYNLFFEKLEYIEKVKGV